MNILGLKIVKHDTGASLISDNKIVAIAEERLNKIKHSPNIFPKLSIDYCLKEMNIEPEDISLIVIDQVDNNSRFSMKDIFLKNTGNRFKNAEIHVINHHDAHAASAFFVSPFDESAIFVCDGAGEKFNDKTETETLYRGKGNKLYQLQKTTHLRKGKIFPYTWGIGKLYTYLSEYYLNFGAYNEGKMMGLASYGTKLNIPENYFFRELGNDIICNSFIRFPYKFSRIKSFFKREKNPYFPKIKLERKIRTNEKLPDNYYSSIAYTGQYILEEVLKLWGEKLKKITQSDNLCVAGGVGLNIDANKNFLDKVGFKKLFIQPGSSDTGIPLGCALYGYHVIKNKPRFFIMRNASLGRSYTEGEILNASRKEKDKIYFRKSSNIAKETAKLIAEGSIIGWFQDGSEYGPRALGNRSIICDARRKDMKDILNDKVKHRESWRPFATSILKEYLSEYFEIKEDSPFMLLAAKVKKDKIYKIPAVIHIDNTSRIQSVTKYDNGKYYELISEFNKLTNIPLVLNTSFNLAGDPIVETPEDAINTFLKTKIDYLVLEDYLVSKNINKY